MISKTHIFFSLIFTSFFTVKSSNASSAPNSVSFLLACGSRAAATDASGRKWVLDSKFLTNSENSITATAQSQDPSLPSSIPYMTARIFTSSSTYTFPVSPTNRHWVRFHFYPSSYSKFNTSAAYLSVISNGFTLMKNFSASITSQALTQDYVIKEFSLNPIQSSSLNLTITPKTGAVAFVNGIEVISMPEIFQPGIMVGFSDQSIDTKNYTLQTMFRLNVGGQYIPSTSDSGLSRIWYDDSPYLYGAALGITSEAEKNVTIRYPSNLPEYIAPLSRTNQRAFDIFINNQTAQLAADVLAWADSKKDVPVYKDFAVYVGEGNGGEELWVALHPSVLMKPEFYDAILNGLEIFKVNDTSGNLAGPNPVPSGLQKKEQEPRSFAQSKSSNLGAIIGGVFGGLVGFGLLVGVLVFLNSKKRKTGGGKKSNPSGWLPLYRRSQSFGTKSTISGKSSGSSQISTLGGGLCRHFSLSEIKYATNSFAESVVIGVGGFGKVYKGIIDGGVEVAIKRSNPSSEQGVHEFQTEIDLLSKLRHRHLDQVSLVDWALFNYRNGTIDTVIDHHIKGETSPECLNKFVETAVKCLSDQGIERPSMGSVLWNLEYALQLQDHPDGPKVVAEQKANDAFAMQSKLLSFEEEGEETEDSTNAIFSEIVDPQGR
ncbi:malectin/receptor-like protein kinase family protein [Actinidia rufa]|uniref:Malectin/receptor-like protein kinase family protein n=1 Tax=Actinidia rufa TaxID=165716 RepID=A0A7J0GSV8_9ERIC|nr:malectin/receptor-like protein kinase family protein [Actinidia rufa]